VVVPVAGGQHEVLLEVAQLSGQLEVAVADVRLVADLVGMADRFENFVRFELAVENLAVDRQGWVELHT